MRRPSPRGWESSLLRCGWIARRNTPWSPAARLIIYLRLPTRPDYREKIWDHAAGALIVSEAGGVVTDVTGRPLEFNHGHELAVNQGVIVTNGRLHQRVIESINNLAYS